MRIPITMCHRIRPVGEKPMTVEHLADLSGSRRSWDSSPSGTMSCRMARQRRHVARAANHVRFRPPSAVNGLLGS